MKPKTQFSVCLPGPQFRKLDKLAKKGEISRSSCAAQILAKHLDELEAKAA